MEKGPKGNLKPRRRKLPENIVFGTRAVMEAVQAGKEFERLFIQKNISNPLNSELLQLLKKRKVTYTKVPVEKLNSITRRNHQGAIGYISPISYSSVDHVITSAYEAGEEPFLLVLDRITDIRNFGAICRTAEGAGVHGVVVPERGGAMINSDAIKTSAGALSHLAICREPNLSKTIDFLKNNGLTVLCCTEKTETLIYDCKLKGPLAVILGSEENGILPEYLEKSDELGKIPMLGNISSLNVSVAAGVLMYEAVRQRGL